MSIYSKNPVSPIRCFIHKDYNLEHLCGGKKCEWGLTPPFLYRPYDYIYNPQFKKIVKSKLRYFIK